jgi:acyl-coenzyme A synthetase/AMP-(fatty) acid ligase
MTRDASIALLGPFDAGAELARGAQRRHSQSDYLRAVWALSEALPQGRHVLNFCRNRYHFLVGLGACLVAQKISLLPSTRTLAVLQQIEQQYPDAFCLHDGQGLGELCSDANDRDKPTIRLFAYPADLEQGPETTQKMPAISSAQVAAYVFTSGSTGAPQAHAKLWGSLVSSAQAEACALDFGTQTWAVVGTVPSQHMYGFESLIMLTLHGGATLWERHPFYPADIASALESVAQPRMLVTSPTHLRALLAAQIACPPIDKLLCATAPLPLDVVQQAEQTFRAPLYEIYGCTETGQMASRRSAQTLLWRLFPQVQIEQREGKSWAHGGHILQPTLLADIIETKDRENFLLMGRSSDLINIAGKRSSLAHVNHALLSISGVVDGCMFVPDAAPHSGQEQVRHPDSTRLCAIVVAPQMSAAEILLALRKRLDPAFLPRPIILVQSLPRNPTGKLPRDALLEILHQHLRVERGRVQ